MGVPLMGDGVESQWLLLWDLDGTLISSFPGVEQLYIDALSRAIDQTVENVHLETHGRTDMSILADCARQAGVDERSVAVILPQALFELGRVFEESFGSYLKQCSVLPGAVEALGVLADMNVVNGVVTGNARLNAWRKITGLGMGNAIRLGAGAYGDESVDRYKLVSLALARANVLYRRVYPKSHVVVVGDTPLDAVAARRAGAKIILVSTGRYDIGTLRQSTPDLVISDLDNGLGAIKDFVASD